MPAQCVGNGRSTIREHAAAFGQCCAGCGWSALTTRGDQTSWQALGAPPLTLIAYLPGTKSIVLARMHEAIKNSCGLAFPGINRQTRASIVCTQPGQRLLATVVQTPDGLIDRGRAS